MTDRAVPAGALGPRLAGRLTAELIARSPQYMNCCNDYELDLRGNKLSSIENLGATQNQFDSIDLSDNSIVKLEGFPKLPRLKMVLLNSNRITRIGEGLEDSIPNLEWLMLTSNKLSNITDLQPLCTLPKLKYLSLMDNLVTKKPDYRLYVIHLCPKLKVLDFRKVKEKERQLARQTFGDAAEASAKTTFEPDTEMQEAAAKVVPAPAPAPAAKGPTPEQVTAIKAAIANASTLEEVQRLEAALKGGNLPSQIQVGVSKSSGQVNGTTHQAMEEG